MEGRESLARVEEWEECALAKPALLSLLASAAAEKGRPHHQSRLRETW